PSVGPSLTYLFFPFFRGSGILPVSPSECGFALTVKSRNLISARTCARVARSPEASMKTLSRCLPALLLMLAAALFCVPGHGQTTFNEREVKSMPSQFDKVGVWAMEFRFKDPRIITVKLPTRGERHCWYLWYQVINRTGKPEEISPYFELVTLDTPGIYRDE